ncbi:MAG: DUF4124 domain-containing protein [Desulfuromonadales bacterium]
MRLLPVVLACALLYAAPLRAETYSWTDESGTVNFTEDYASVPPKYRNMVNIRGDIGAVPSQAEPLAGSVSRDPKNSNPDQAKPVAIEAETLYDGKKFEEWKREFAALESEVNTLDARVKEAEAEFKQMSKGGGATSEQLQRMNESYKGAIDSYNKAAGRYDLLVESARKAGVPFEIRK